MAYFSKKNLILSLLFASLGSVLAWETSFARDKGDVTGLDIPRFVSLRSDKVFLRSGPGTNYPINWVYNRKYYPVEIIKEFDVWRRVRDHEGEEGWVHQSLLSGKRYAYLTKLPQQEETVPIFYTPDPQSRVVARLEQGVTAKIEECEAQWCTLSINNYQGWVEKKYLWGIYPNEGIN